MALSGKLVHSLRYLAHYEFCREHVDMKHSYACISALLKYERSNFEVAMRISIKRDMLAKKACLESGVK